MSIRKLISAIFISILVFANQTSAQKPNKLIKTIISTKSEQSKDFIEGKTIIAEVEFTGLDSNYENDKDAVYLSDFLKQLREKRASIVAEETFNAKKIEKILVLLKEWLALKGFLKAEVIALGEKLPENQMKLIFSVKRETPIEVSEIKFIGNINISNDEYVADFKQCLNDSWKKYDVQKYNFITQKCSRSLMFTKGFLSGNIIRINRRLVENSYVVTVEVNEGVRYRIGEIKIGGAKVFSQKELLEILGQKEGDIADGKAIREFFYEKLKSVYLDKGYVLYNAEFDVDFIEPQVEGLDGIVNIKGEIEEGWKFKLGKIEFVGVEKKKVQELRKFFLEVGEIYNQGKVKEGIKKINDLKEFYFVDDEQHVEIRTDEENPNIHLIIRVRKIEQ